MYAGIEYFTENELLILRGKTKQVHWTAEEAMKAITVRLLGPKSYKWWRNERKFPLPSKKISAERRGFRNLLSGRLGKEASVLFYVLYSKFLFFYNVSIGVSSLQKWAARIEINRGVLDQILGIMRATSGDQFHRLTVVLFNEMKIKESIEYDPHEDEVIGPHKKLQVGMARGLCSQWKTPIFADFDTKMVKTILVKIISKLHDAGYIVVACVSDAAAENRGLWNDLRISKDQLYFRHPCTGKKIASFYDVPHLLKLFRNWLLDTGFRLPDGTVLTKAPLFTLLQITNTEVSTCFKLKDLHFNVKRSQRQNVRLAAELISHTVASALRRYNIDPKLADTIQLMNDRFDRFNTRTGERKNVSSSPYGTLNFIDLQNKLLEQVDTFIRQMRCCGKNSLQVPIYF